jgi:hypothetical protein
MDVGTNRRRTCTIADVSADRQTGQAEAGQDYPTLPSTNSPEPGAGDGLLLKDSLPHGRVELAFQQSHLGMQAEVGLLEPRVDPLGLSQLALHLEQRAARLGVRRLFRSELSLVPNGLFLE